MPLTPGTRLGVYEVTAPIGAGGMGEVYKATDTNLKRAVALKVLPESVAADVERLARFQREAEVLASLNHPNIAAIYGFEKSRGLTALVMELVEGEDLSQRIARGALPLDEALPIAKQIAEALEAAHEQGIIHRDLKPANIKVRPDGTVKVLDLGLAKALDQFPASSPQTPAPGLSMSPTITTPAMTQAGMILGTAAYMSPEQAAGRPADQRSDVWAFGVVLFEMLTGRQVFAGETVSHMLASVLKDEPDWAALPVATPAPIRRLLRRCLQKDRKHRLDSAAAARLEIDEALSGSVIDAPARIRSRGGRQPLVWMAAAALAMLAIVVVGLAARLASKPADAPRVTRLQIAPTGTEAVSISGFDNDFAMTPDGSRIVYVGDHGTELLVRALDALDPVVIAQGEIRAPFISPDGQWVGFVSNAQTLRKVALTGGPSLSFLNVPGGVRGASWTPDGGVVFASISGSGGLQYLSPGGDTPTELTRPDHARGERDHWWPEVLPGGRGVLFTIMLQNGGLDAAEIAVLDLQTHTSKVLVRGGSHARYVPSGYLVYGAGGALRAIRFDLAQLSATGTSAGVVPRVSSTALGAVNVAAGGDTLVYAPGDVATTSGRSLVWIDRQGHATPLHLPERLYGYPRVSPDGTRIVVTSPEQEYDLWLWDLKRSQLTRATFDSSQDSFPVWMPDSRRVVFTSGRDGGQNVFWQAADNAGAAERLTLTDGSVNSNPSSISPDGTRLLFSQNDLKNGYDVMMLRLDGSRKIEPLIQTPSNERNAEISPDGRWVTYQSDESGQNEIYVRPFPATDRGRWQISAGGGTRPVWAHSGRELFYVAPGTGALLGVTVDRGPTWTATAPYVLLPTSPAITPGFGGRSYDISPDDQRFLMVGTGVESVSNSKPTSLVVVQHWSEALKQLVRPN